MQFLLAQLMFKKSPKAALKALDGYIYETSTFVQSHHLVATSDRFLDSNIAPGYMHFVSFGPRTQRSPAIQQTPTRLLTICLKSRNLQVARRIEPSI
jgi:hypothetical protein